MMDILSALNAVLPGLDEGRRALFSRYFLMLIDWNERVNLTAITDPFEAAEKHFADSLLPEGLIPFGSKCIDIGTGAGFPGIPLKIVRQDIELTLLDSLNKRLNFLKAVTEELGIPARIVHARAEDGARQKDFRESFDVTFCRAVAPVNTAAELTVPYLRTGGISILYKGPGAKEELKSAEKALKLLSASAKVIERSTNWGERNIVVLTKLAPTPSNYPRKAGTPSKAPL
jgi:16S rRNA (guanine527-N7)-methyltransferase